jgi:hypothetical protein
VDRDSSRLRADISTTVTGEGLLSGVVALNLGTAARTDTLGVTKGQVHAYVTGATVVLQIFDGTAWRSVTLS